MPKTNGPNIARIVYDSYPHSDLLPIDPATDRHDLAALMHRVWGDDIGDSLFRFLVVEIVEGGEGTLDGAIRVVRRARDDVHAVLQGLIQARNRKEHPREPVQGCPPRIGPHHR
jgi:hypothetical protein